MKTQFFVTVLVAAVGFIAAPSFVADNHISGEVGYVPEISASVSSATRDAVRAQYLQAQRKDALPEWGEGLDVGTVASAKSTLTRDAARAEAV